MAIQIKKKPAAESLSKEDTAALVAAGIMPAPEQKEVSVKTKGEKLYSIGQRVRVTNTLYHWVKNYKPGDIGTITRVSRVNKDNGTSTTLYDVILDTPRVDEGRVILAGWEIEEYGND